MFDARRGNGDMAAPVGDGQEVIVRVGRRHGNDVRIGSWVKRRGFRAGIAGGSNENNAPLPRGCESPRDLRVVGSREAHIDDPSATRDGPIDACDDCRCGSFGGREGANRKNARRWGNAREPCMRDNGARHGGAVTVAGLAGIDRIEASRDRIRDLRVRRVDPGIDDCDQYSVARRGAVGFSQPKLGQHVLHAVDLDGRLPPALLQRETIVRLGRAYAPIRLNRANDIGNGALVSDAPAMDSGAREANGLRVRAGSIDGDRQARQELAARDWTAGAARPRRQRTGARRAEERRCDSKQRFGFRQRWRAD